MARVFDQVMSALTKCIEGATKKPVKTLTVPGMRKALAGLSNTDWLSLVLKVALNRRKFATCEGPDALVFTATQLHNHLKTTYGNSLLYEDSVCLALVLSGETTLPRARESLQHLDSGLVYIENGEDSEEDDDDDSFVVKSDDEDGEVLSENSTAEEESAVETPCSSDDESVEDYSKESAKKKRKT